MAAAQPEVDRWSERHAWDSTSVRRPAHARRNGTKIGELVLPMERAGGRHERKHGERKPGMSRGTAGERGPGRAPGVASGVTHSKVNGPEGEGIVITVPLAVALVDRN